MVLAQRFFQLLPENIRAPIGWMAEACGGEACIGEGDFTFPSDSEEGEISCHGNEFLGEGEADGEFFITGGAIGEEIFFFVRVEGENVPQNKFIRRKTGFQAGAPYHGVRRLVEAFFFLRRFHDEGGVLAAGSLALVAQDHLAIHFRMLVQNHSLAGHGDAGEVATLVPAGFGDENHLCLAEAKGEIVHKLLLPDGDGAVYFIVRRRIAPGVEGVLAGKGGEVGEKAGNGGVHKKLLGLSGR